MNLALFDFDGTITSRELFVDFVESVTPRRRMQRGKVLLGPILMGYKCGLVSVSQLRAAVIRLAFRGSDAAELWASAPGCMRLLTAQREWTAACFVIRPP